MRFDEFNIQDSYCREQNTPIGKGCDSCPALDKEHCADRLRNLASKLRNSLGNKKVFRQLSEDLERDYGLSSFNQLAIFRGELEFSE